MVGELPDQPRPASPQPHGATTCLLCRTPFIEGASVTVTKQS